MTLTLDPAIEQRLQRLIASGAYKDPADLISRFLDLAETEEDWLRRNKRALQADFEESIAQGERGEVFTEDQLRARMAARRASHPMAQTP